MNCKQKRHQDGEVMLASVAGSLCLLVEAASKRQLIEIGKEQVSGMIYCRGQNRCQIYAGWHDEPQNDAYLVVPKA